LSQVTLTFIIYSQKFNSEQLVSAHHYLHLPVTALSYMQGGCMAWERPVDSVCHLCGREPRTAGSGQRA